MSKKQNWLLAIAIMIFSFTSVMLALICIFSLPDASSKPLVGVYYFLGGAIAISAFLFTLWKKTKENNPRVNF